MVLIGALTDKTQVAQAVQNLIAGRYVANYVLVNRPYPVVLTMGMYA